MLAGRLLGVTRGRPDGEQVANLAQARLIGSAAVMPRPGSDGWKPQIALGSTHLHTCRRLLKVREKSAAAEPRPFSATATDLGGAQPHGWTVRR